MEDKVKHGGGEMVPFSEVRGDLVDDFPAILDRMNPAPRRWPASTGVSTPRNYGPE
jgi:hypothetical protein